MVNKIKKYKTIDILIHLFLMVLGISMIFPFIWMLLNSFKTTAEITRIPPALFPENWMNLKNFSTVLTKYKFQIFFKNSVYYALMKTMIVLYVSSLSGYVLAKFQFPGRKAIFVMILASMMIPWPVTLIPSYQLMIWLQWVNRDISIFYTGFISGFGIFLMRQFSQGIPDSLMEAARIDGAGEMLIYHRIVMPMMLNAVGALAIFTFIWEWDNFLWPFLMLNDMKKFTIPIGLAMTKGQFVSDFGPMFAGISISVIPVLIFYLIFQRSFISGIALGATKG